MSAAHCTSTSFIVALPTHRHIDDTAVHGALPTHLHRRASTASFGVARVGVARHLRAARGCVPQRTPLFMAAAYGFGDVMRALVNAGGNVNAPGKGALARVGVARVVCHPLLRSPARRSPLRTLPLPQTHLGSRR